jgi:hypothetical protein
LRGSFMRGGEEDGVQRRAVQAELWRIWLVFES